MIRSATRVDAGAICEIYNHYILESTITFEEQPVGVSEIGDRIENVSRSLPWLVLEENDAVIGYAYAITWQVRSAYRFSVESSIYLNGANTGRGYGSILYRKLIERVRERGMHCMVGGIALPNAASIALHEKLGFSKVAHFAEIGRKFDRWIDVGYWELTL